MHQMTHSGPRQVRARLGCLSCSFMSDRKRRVWIAASGRTTIRINWMDTISSSLPAFTPQAKDGLWRATRCTWCWEPPLAGPPVSETSWSSSVCIKLREKHLSSRQARSHAGGSRLKASRDLVSMVTLMVRLKNCAFLGACVIFRVRVF